MALFIALSMFSLLSHEVSSQLKMQPYSVKIENASEVLEKICKAISSQSSGDQKLTFVFVLITTADYRTSFNFLWSLPNSHVYLSTEHIALRDNDREVTISWERDVKPPGSFRDISAFWDIYNECGSRNCTNVVDTIQSFQLEKRVLVQVRELLPLEWYRNPPLKIRRRMKTSLGYTFYYHHYKSTLVVLRELNGDTVHSSLIIKRSNRVVGSTVAELVVKDFDISDARRVFDHIPPVSNHSSEFILSFTILSFRDGGDGHVVAFNSCLIVSITANEGSSPEFFLEFALRPRWLRSRSSPSFTSSKIVHSDAALQRRGWGTP